MIFADSLNTNLNMTLPLAKLRMIEQIEALAKKESILI